METAALDHLWLQCQQRLFAHVAHDLKGALNGASVNLEVVRSRSERSDTPISDVTQYAAAATEQLAVVIETSTALLSVGRAVRGPSEVATVIRQIVALLADTLRSDGAKLALVVDGGVAGVTSAPASAVRLALAETLMSAAIQKRDVSVRIHPGGSPRVEIRSEATFEVFPDVGRALTEVGITIKTDGHGISIIFPGP